MTWPSMTASRLPRLGTLMVIAPFRALKSNAPAPVMLVAGVPAPVTPTLRAILALLASDVLVADASTALTRVPELVFLAFPPPPQAAASNPSATPAAANLRPAMGALLLMPQESGQHRLRGKEPG